MDSRGSEVRLVLLVEGGKKVKVEECMVLEIESDMVKMNQENSEFGSFVIFQFRGEFPFCPDSVITDFIFC